MNKQCQRNTDDKFREKPVNYIDTFRRNLDALMAQHDYTIKETAELADISFDTFKTFLYDKEARDCRLSTAIKLAKAFHLSIDELVGAGTFKPEGLESIKAYRTLPEGSKRFLDWHIRNQKFLHEKHGDRKLVNVMLPLCANNGNMKQTNDYEIMDITHLGDDLAYKIFLGIKIPCLHYLPHYTEGDVLLIANDRDAMRGENTVVMFNDNLVIINRKFEFGKENYYSLRDGKLRPVDPDQVQIIGYVAKIIRV